MKRHWTRTIHVGAILWLMGLVAAEAQSSNSITSEAVYVADYSHSSQPLPDGVLIWDAMQKSVDATDGQDSVAFNFSFTNASPDTVAILSARGSCSCTTVKTPPTPWLIPAGSNGQFSAKMDIAGKFGTVFKSVIMVTDKGTKNLGLRVNILPPAPVSMTEEQKAAGIAAAKVDRQAVFKGDCASCHAKKVENLYGPQLYNAVCGICHEAENRATMVPDLGKLKVATSPDFWRTWITYGKAGTLMPAFATSQGGPLTDAQIASLAGFLNIWHPNTVTAPQ